MNKQFQIINGQKVNTKIEWCDYTWNPVAGCMHGCRWTMPDGKVAVCYAETVAERVAQKAYPEGFDHHYSHLERLGEPAKIKEPAKIFIDSMSDLMGSWVPRYEVEAVLAACEKYEQHTFIMLTKNAPKLKEFTFPKNVWVLVSSPPDFYRGHPMTLPQQQRMLETSIRILHELKANGQAHTIGMSAEPVSWNIAMSWHYPLDWLIIGAASNGRDVYLPDEGNVRNLLGHAKHFNAPVFFKGNLKGHPCATPWREEFPR